MTTPEQIIAKIEEIEVGISSGTFIIERTSRVYLLEDLLQLKQMLIEHFNLPTADPPEGSPGQEDMKGGNIIDEWDD